MTRQRKQRLALIFTIVSAVNFLIGISGIPGDVETWTIWIASALSFIDANVGRWLFMLLGVPFALLAFYFWMKPSEQPAPITAAGAPRSKELDKASAVLT